MVNADIGFPHELIYQASLVECASKNKKHHASDASRLQPVVTRIVVRRFVPNASSPIARAAVDLRMLRAADGKVKSQSSETPSYRNSATIQATILPANGETIHSRAATVVLPKAPAIFTA